MKAGLDYRPVYTDTAYLRYHDDFCRRESGLGAEDDGACLIEDDNGQVLFLYPEHDASGWEQVPGGIWEEG
jgi:hypothetical protein